MTRSLEGASTAPDSGKHALSVIEGRSLATKGRGVWGEGAPEGTAGWDLQAKLVVQNGPKLDFRSVLFKVFFKRVVASVFYVFFAF